MGFFDKLVIKLTGSSAQPPAPPGQRTAAGFTVTISGPAGPAVQVTDAEVASRAAEHSFVLETDPPVLRTADEWWNEETHKRRRREGSEKAYAWLLPFVPLEIAQLPQLQAAQDWGPHGATAMAKELRALIRVRRKAKERHDDLLRALYGTCVAVDLGKSLVFEGTQTHYMARFVDINELREVALDYRVVGYQCIESLSKTDVKWLVEAFGEPAEHQSFAALWPGIRRNAIARYCWKELRAGGPQQSMTEWLNRLVRRNIGYHKEWEERCAARQVYLQELAAVLDSAWTATRQPFVVADLETTGLNADTDDVLEFGAIRVTADGTVTGEFSILVKVAQVPPVITRLTGITQDLVDRDGVPLPAAMKAFAEFVGPAPIFFHNAPFDRGFLKKASAQTGVKMPNATHDTLPLVRQAWPGLETYKLSAVAEQVGVPSPAHRALVDAKTALAVVLAARKRVAATA